jgi:hypothetical protein
MMNLDDDVPHLLGGVGEGLVPQDPGVVDDAVDLVEGIDAGLQDVLSTLEGGHIVVVRNGLAAGGPDLLDHFVRHGAPAAGAVARTTEVVDDDRGARLRQRERVVTSNAAARARHDDRLSVHQPHAKSSSRGSSNAQH